MTPKTKLIRTVYLYIAALGSLIFVASGTGMLINTGLKYYVFPKAEKGGYSQCNQQPPVYGLEKSGYVAISTADQKIQLENLLNDYAQWKQNNTGEECYIAQRQSTIVDALTMIVIALPILLLHWIIIKKEKAEKE
ncbi:MAG: hypothetical protein Q7T51_03940 [Candidatus Moranbacteria bacterium]|nr:hypothetical protein [Candidatus Moranbacteria bacterium]